MCIKERHIQQWNRTESPETGQRARTHVQTTFDKGASTIHGREDSLSNKRCQEKPSIHVGEDEAGPHLTPYAKINSKRRKDLNVRSETIQPLEENTGHKASQCWT